MEKFYLHKKNKRIIVRFQEEPNDATKKLHGEETTKSAWEAQQADYESQRAATEDYKK